jgi:hypothetical protein
VPLGRALELLLPSVLRPSAPAPAPTPGPRDGAWPHPARRQVLYEAWCRLNVVDTGISGFVLSLVAWSLGLQQYSQCCSAAGRSGRLAGDGDSGAGG